MASKIPNVWSVWLLTWVKRNFEVLYHRRNGSSRFVLTLEGRHNLTT